MCMLLNRFDLKEVIEYANKKIQAEKISYVGQEYEFTNIKYIDIDVNEDLELIEVIVKMDFNDKCYPKIGETIKELNELFNVNDFNIDDKFRYNIYSFRSEKLYHSTIYPFS